MSFYARDLAHVHHVGFSGVALGAAPYLLEVLASVSSGPGFLVDLGCGAGVWLNEARKAGHMAVGVEISPDFVALAQAVNPDTPILQGSVYDAPLPPCTMVTAIGEVLCYIPSETSPPPPVASLFQRIYQALQPGGVFLFDVIAAAPEHALSGRSWRAEDDWAVLVDAHEDEGAALLKRHVVTFRQDGALYRRTDEHHVQYLFEARRLEEALQAAGFKTRRGSSYGDFALAPRRVMIEARKPGR